MSVVVEALILWRGRLARAFFKKRGRDAHATEQKSHPNLEPHPVDQTMRPDPDQWALFEVNAGFALHAGTPVGGDFAIDLGIHLEGVASFLGIAHRDNLIDRDWLGLVRLRGRCDLSGLAFANHLNLALRHDDL